MSNHETHDERDFDGIVGDPAATAILASRNLLPSAWDLPQREQKRILGSGLTLRISSKLPMGNWPACADCTSKSVTVASDFLETDQFTCGEKLATIVHEIGHIVNPEPPEQPILSRPESERIADYLGAMAPEDTPAALTEIYADD